MSYIEIEHALRLGLQSIKHGVEENKLEEQHDLVTKRMLAEKKELEKILAENHDVRVERSYQNMGFWSRIKFALEALFN